jgi:hypothetical protein
MVSIQTKYISGIMTKKKWPTPSITFSKYICEACSNESQLQTDLGEESEGIKTRPHDYCSRYLTVLPPEQSLSQVTHWAVLKPQYHHNNH